MTSSGIQGQRQSPIDLRVTDSLFDPKLDSESFEFHYDQTGCTHLKNVGKNFAVSCDRSTLKASHLPDTYRLAQFHAHWNTNPWNGSEHQMMGVGTVGEIHLVHWRAKYGSFEAATKHPDGVAVLAVFMDESPHDNPDLERLMKAVAAAKNVGDTVSFQGGFDLKKLLPGKKDFWTYEGSLTTPPYTECVIWTVLKAPIDISYQQLRVLRRLAVSNVRPIQKLNGRVPRASFELGGRISYSSGFTTN